MSAANVDLVKALYPLGGLDWAAVVADRTSERRYARHVERLLHERFEMVPAQRSGEGGPTVVGSEAYIAALRDVMDAFTRFCIIPERFIDLGDRVVVLARLEGTTKINSLGFAGEGGAIVELEDGLIRRIWEYDNRPALLAAAGLTDGEGEAGGGSAAG